jgi:hypothetical protein
MEMFTRSDIASSAHRTLTALCCGRRRPQAKGVADHRDREGRKKGALADGAATRVGGVTLGTQERFRIGSGAADGRFSFAQPALDSLQAVILRTQWDSFQRLDPFPRRLGFRLDARDRVGGESCTATLSHLRSHGAREPPHDLFGLLVRRHPQCFPGKVAEDADHGTADRDQKGRRRAPG